MSQRDALLVARLLLEAPDGVRLAELRQGFYRERRGEDPEARLMAALRELESRGCASRWVERQSMEVVVDCDRSRLVSLAAPPGPRGRLSGLGD